MVNPDSKLYREHPDWVLNFPYCPRTEARNQLVLNLARPDVRAYVFGFLDKLLTENDIAFLKWDYNRNWSEPGWPAVAPDEEKEVYVKYVENLYSILAELRARHPKVEIESCSGGGGRVDLGILALHRRGVDLGQYRCFRPADHTEWIHLSICACHHDGVGYGFAELA